MIYSTSGLISTKDIAFCSELELFEFKKPIDERNELLGDTKRQKILNDRAISMKFQATD